MFPCSVEICGKITGRIEVMSKLVKYMGDCRTNQGNVSKLMQFNSGGINAFNPINQMQLEGFNKISYL